MDTLLEPLWRTGQKPFHSKTIFPSVEVFVEDAMIAISSALRHIEIYYPSNRLFAFDDWHEHDGFVTPARPISISELREQIKTPASYAQSLSDDTAVYRAIYPDSLDFVLRYSLSDEDSLEAPDREVHWTFTGYGHDIVELQKRWQPFGLSVEASCEFFLKRYAG